MQNEVIMQYKVTMGNFYLFDALHLPLTPSPSCFERSHFFLTQTSHMVITFTAFNVWFWISNLLIILLIHFTCAGLSWLIIWKAVLLKPLIKTLICIKGHIHLKWKLIRKGGICLAVTYGIFFFSFLSILCKRLRSGHNNVQSSYQITVNPVTKSLCSGYQITVLRLPNHDLVAGVQWFGSWSTMIW